MKSTNPKKLKDLCAKLSIVKKAYRNETDFKVREGLIKTLHDLIASIESEVGAPICTMDKNLFF
jgi:hypothetical protein